jgi:hypothetical protein
VEGSEDGALARRVGVEAKPRVWCDGKLWATALRGSAELAHGRPAAVVRMPTATARKTLVEAMPKSMCECDASFLMSGPSAVE